MSPEAMGSSGGGDVDDEYRWMHDVNSEEVLRHFEVRRTFLLLLLAAQKETAGNGLVPSASAGHIVVYITDGNGKGTKVSCFAEISAPAVEAPQRACAVIANTRVHMMSCV